ncbi:polysaccharide biosynthesis protein [Paenibacillus mesophilus]|uniref:UDP-N-acetylglucosamine 4,6-dehydratase family protein n=1 Tax=Paenibacillus mesophilus TaxID=2582849 RepID=UPI00110D36CD|nr:polysaccharide biosynthesis protein [Paenibacillus mesophilus]
MNRINKRRGKDGIPPVREVNAEELLSREPVKIDLTAIAGYVTGKVIMVTGAGGSIGSELCRQILPFRPNKLLMVDHDENSLHALQIELERTLPQAGHETIMADIRDRKRMEDLFSFFRPSIVFHAAAHKHVPLMETNEAEAVKTNIFGTRIMIECASNFAVERFVFISTDKTVKPSSMMGATKRIAEMVVQSANAASPTNFIIVRFGNVIGSRGSVLPLFQQQIREGGPVTVTHPDMVRYFMTIREAVQLVIQAGAFTQGGELFVLDMGQPVKIAELARKLIRMSGFEPDRDIPIVYTGIRPGEKIVEELLTEEEGIQATRHDRIWICSPHAMSEQSLSAVLGRLEELLSEQNQWTSSEQIRGLIRLLLPGMPGRSRP